MGLGVNICDINNDGFPDIYVSNDFHENDYLYINNGNGTFSERLTEFIQHTSRSSMGNDVADINNDGLLDIMVLDMLPEEEKIRKQSGGEDENELYLLKLEHGYGYQFVRNTLQLNLGGGMFSEIGRLAGIYATDWSWSPLFCDVDNDGWKDLFITNGIYRRANDLDYVKFLTKNSFFTLRKIKMLRIRYCTTKCHCIQTSITSIKTTAISHFQIWQKHGDLTPGPIPMAPLTLIWIMMVIWI